MGNEETFAATPNSESDSGDSAGDASGVASASHPERIARFRIEKVLGKGGFGLVYLAYDEQLGRPVAVKVPHARLISAPRMLRHILPKLGPLPILITPTSFRCSKLAAQTSFPASSFRSTSKASTFHR